MKFNPTQCLIGLSLLILSTISFAEDCPVGSVLDQCVMKNGVCVGAKLNPNCFGGLNCSKYIKCTKLNGVCSFDENKKCSRIP